MIKKLLIFLSMFACLLEGGVQATLACDEPPCKRPKFGERGAMAKEEPPLPDDNSLPGVFFSAVPVSGNSSEEQVPKKPGNFDEFSADFLGEIFASLSIQ